MNNTTKYKLVPMIALNKDEAALDQMQNELLSILKAPNMSSLEKRMIYEDLLKRVHNFKMNQDPKFMQHAVEDVMEQEQVQRRMRSPSPFEQRGQNQLQDYAPQPQQQIAQNMPEIAQFEQQRDRRDDIPRIQRGNISKRARGAPKPKPLRDQRDAQLQGIPAIPQPGAPVAFVPAPQMQQQPVPMQQQPVKRKATNDGRYIRFPPARDLAPPNRAPRYPQQQRVNRKRALNAPIGVPPRAVPFVRNLTTRKRITPRDALPRHFGETRSKQRQLGGGRLRVQSWL